jgi:hypothetical protein
MTSRMAAEGSRIPINGFASGRLCHSEGPSSEHQKKLSRSISNHKNNAISKPISNQDSNGHNTFQFKHGKEQIWLQYRSIFETAGKTPHPVFSPEYPSPKTMPRKQLTASIASIASGKRTSIRSHSDCQCYSVSSQ